MKHFLFALALVVNLSLISVSSYAASGVEFNFTLTPNSMMSKQVPKIDVALERQVGDAVSTAVRVSGLQNYVGDQIELTVTVSTDIILVETNDDVPSYVTEAMAAELDIALRSEVNGFIRLARKAKQNEQAALSEELGLRIRTIIGDIVTFDGTLRAVVLATQNDLIRYFEGSRPIYPNPAITVRN